MTKRSKYEKETILNFNEAEATATIYTYNASLKRRLAEFSRKYPVPVSYTHLDGADGVHLFSARSPASRPSHGDYPHQPSEQRKMCIRDRHEAVPARGTMQCAYHHEQSLHFIGQSRYARRRLVKAAFYHAKGDTT